MAGPLVAGSVQTTSLGKMPRAGGYAPRTSCPPKVARPGAATPTFGVAAHGEVAFGCILAWSDYGA